MSMIKQLSAIEILDSRGRPTLLTICALENGTVGTASVPSGASTGAAEALELRDNDPNRYAGMGVLQAAENVCGEINAATSGKVFEEQADFDAFLIALDGTPNKSRLGANAVLSASLGLLSSACRRTRSSALQAFFTNRGSESAPAQADDQPV